MQKRTSASDFSHPAYAEGITVSIVSHGQRDPVTALISQIAALGDASIHRVIVTHNLPDSPLPPPAGCSFEWIQIHNPKPLGFSANHNQAFLRCETAWFAVLNPDIELPFGNPFPALLEAAHADPRLGAVAPTLIQPVTLHAEPPRGVVTPYEIIRRRLPGWKHPKEPSWLVGAFLLIRAEAFHSLKGFDERYTLYCEDVDLGIRMLSAGWRIRRLDRIRVLHQTQRNSHKKLKYTITHLGSLIRLWWKLAFRKDQS